MSIPRRNNYEVAAHIMNEKPHEPKLKPAMPPPRKPPGRGAIAGVGGNDDRPKKHETVRIALPPKSTATPRITPPTDSAK